MGADSHVDYSYKLDVGEHGADVDGSVGSYGSKATSQGFVAPVVGLMAGTSERVKQPGLVVRAEHDVLKVCRGTAP